MQNGFALYVDMFMTLKSEILTVESIQALPLRIFQMTGFALTVVLVKICLKKNRFKARYTGPYCI